MDLTNIKPCVECKHFSDCCAWYSTDGMMIKRHHKTKDCGEDCFEEVDNG